MNIYLPVVVHDDVEGDVDRCAEHEELHPVVYRLHIIYCPARAKMEPKLVRIYHLNHIIIKTLV